MLTTELIERKRDGYELTADQFETFLARYLEDGVADYQMAAFLMAVYFQGLSRDELGVLTRSIIGSGSRLSFDDGGPPVVDKHSTGGVGDKVSLVLAPLLAEAGLRVPMMSGRGLGHTGGTLDKLESIPGFETGLDLNRFRQVLATVGCAMIGQTPEIAPLDGRLYGLRDVTGTVPVVPLIASSIVSKKVAEGIEALVLDVKCGAGAFLPSRADAEALAGIMVELAESEGVRTTALLTAMDQPLGRTVGNALEVREAIDCLHGGGPEDLRDVTIELGAELLESTARSPSIAHAREHLAEKLDDGSALDRFARLIDAQGGDPRIAEHPELLPSAPVIDVFESPVSGFVHAVDAKRVGIAALELGAGRQRVEDPVDPGVGFEVVVRVGEAVEAGAPLVLIHASDRSAAERARVRLVEAISVQPDSPGDPLPLIVGRIGGSD